MFSLYQSSETRREYDGSPSPKAVDLTDAQRMASAVADLPSAHRGAIQWAYLRPGRSPSKVARELGVKPSVLADLLEQAREMLRKRLEPVDDSKLTATIRDNC